MPSHMLMNSPPKIPNPIVVLTPPPHNLRGLCGPLDTSCQMSAPDAAEMAEASLEEIPPSPISETPRPNCGTPLTDMSHLQEKANKALGELLATKSSINTHRWKQFWSWAWSFIAVTEMTESIKAARATCTQTTQDAEALCSTTVKEAKATHTHTIWEAEALCSVTIRDTETQGATWANSLHWEHAKTIQQLGDQVI